MRFLLCLKEAGIGCQQRCIPPASAAVQPSAQRPAASQPAGFRRLPRGRPPLQRPVCLRQRRHIRRLPPALGARRALRQRRGRRRAAVMGGVWRRLRGPLHLLWLHTQRPSAGAAALCRAERGYGAPGPRGGAAPVEPGAALRRFIATAMVFPGVFTCCGCL